MWTYIEALEIWRTFDDEIAESRRLLGSARKKGELDRLKNGLIAVGRFFQDLQKKPLGWVSSRGSIDASRLRQQ
jgi:hypothetical protein